MKRFMERGESNAEGLAILGFLIVIVLLGSRGGLGQSASGPRSTSTPSSTGSAASRPTGTSGGSAIVSPDSPYSRTISLNTGNARSAYQPSQEYISIRNGGREPVDITGWQVKNGMDKRTYYLGGNLQRFPAEVAIIGQGAAILSPFSNNQMRNIVLAPGDTAILTTGRIGSQLPYQIVSFKENMCTGYLQNMPEYSFTPSLTRICPRPANEAGLEWLDTECRTFVSRLPSCQTPDFTQRDRQGEICTNCVNRTPLSNACVAFIKERFNYAGCVFNHSNAENFSSRTWRVFLGRGWEMWANEYENIQIFDQLGRAVTSQSY